GDAGAVPVGGAVEAAGLGLVASRALAAAPPVDDRRVAGGDVGDVDAELAPGRGQEAGEEHVGPLQHRQEQRPPVGVGDVDADRALALVTDLPHVGEAARPRFDAPGGQAPDGVALDGVLDLDDVGPPFGQHGGGRRHQREQTELDDAYSVQQV